MDLLRQEFCRYKREEVKIQAWENHEKRKAEMGMRRMEVLHSDQILVVVFHYKTLEIINC